MNKPWNLLTALALVGACSSPTVTQPASNATEGDTGSADISSDEHRDTSALDQSEGVAIRIASFNASLFRNTEGGLTRALEGGQDRQAQAIAEVVQRIRPDIILLNEFDWDAREQAARIFESDYLAKGWGGQEPIRYEHVVVPTTNTGVPSMVDLDGNGEVETEPGGSDYGNDAFGFGEFPGQYGMVIYSRFEPAEGIRSFSEFRWTDMPDNLLPADFYSAEAIAVFRLSSKNHVDVPFVVGGRQLHVLASHPTPIGFDGDENRNGRRNHDEIRLWTDYIDGADYLVDDDGLSGGLPVDASFVILGDLNRDPFDGDELDGSIRALLEHPRVTDPQPTSDGAVEAAQRDGQANLSHSGPPEHDTADFSDGRVGNLRVDYALPSSDLQVEDAGVHWPSQDEGGLGPARASDHRLVWVDVVF